MDLAIVGKSPFVNESSLELDSILGHTPLKENEGSWGGGGGFGYSDIGQNTFGAPSNRRSPEEWELSDNHSKPSAYQSQRRDHAELPDNMTPMRNQDRSDSSRGQPIDFNGTTAQLRSDPYLTPTQQTFSSPQQQWQPPAFPLQSSTNHQPTDRSLTSPPRKVDTSAPSTEGRAFGVTLTDPGPTPTVSVGSMKSVEMHSGHTVGRSFRASIEGEGDHSSDPIPSQR